MKRLLLLLSLSLLASSVQAQVYTDDAAVVSPATRPAGRYRLRQNYPMYPGYPGTPNTAPDTVEVGRPTYYYPYGNGYPYGAGYPGVSTDGNSVSVPGN